MVGPPPSLRFGVVGIGRIGQRHAVNLLRRIPNAQLVCVCSPAQADLEWAERELVPYGVTIFDSFEAMIEFPGLQAVIVSSLTTLHYQHTVESLKRGVHVLCEKPVSHTVAELDHLIDLTTKNPRTRLMVGFTRRFDESYEAALAKILSGGVGTPLTFRSHAAEPFSDTPFMHNYLKNCGGIFFDSVIHDIDLSLMFLSAGSDKPLIPRQCHAIGLTSLYPHVRPNSQHLSHNYLGDADNAHALVQFSTSQIAHFSNSRTGPSQGGYDNSTEILCTHGKVSVNLAPRKDRVSVHTDAGVGFEVLEGWYERYREAFVREVQHFTEVVLCGGEFRVGLQEVRVGLEIALALQESLEFGGVVWFDERGRRKCRIGGMQDTLGPDYKDQEGVTLRKEGDEAGGPGHRRAQKVEMGADEVGEVKVEKGRRKGAKL